MSDRAVQFMPFAALRGYYEMISQAQRIKEEKKELSEEEKEILSAKLCTIKKRMIVKLTYYENDAYLTTEGMVSEIDPIYQTITIVKKTIPFDDIADICAEEENAV